MNNVSHRCVSIVIIKITVNVIFVKLILAVNLDVQKRFTYE